MRFNLGTTDDVRYISVPWGIFRHPKYAHLDSACKLIYGLLKSRMNLSKMNHWVDENGDIFFFMRLDELGEEMNMGKSNICKKLKMLEEAGLLERQDCSWSRSPKMYLHQIELVEEEPATNKRTRYFYVSPAASNAESVNCVSSEKYQFSQEKVEVSEVSYEEPIYNNIEIQEENNKSINNNNRREVNSGKTVSEPLEPIGNFFRSIGIAAHTVERLLVKYTAERLREVIDILKMQTGVRNSAGFIVAALRFNYQLPGSCCTDSTHDRVAPEDSQEENALDAERPCQYVVEERPAMNMQSPEIIAGVINTIEALFKRRGRIFKIYEDWLKNHDMTMVNGKVVAIV